MKLLRMSGATSQIFQVFVQDSSKTDGSGLIGLAFGTSGLTAYYHRDTDSSTGTAITLVTMTKGTYTSGGFIEIDQTNMPGWYQFCPPNAALAAGASSVGFHLKGATNMAPLPIEVDLTPQVDVEKIGGQAVSASGTVTFPAATLASTTNIAAGTITTAINLTNLPSIPSNWITAAGIAASALNGKGDWLTSSGYTAPPSAASVATAVWQDLTSSGDFTTAGSIGNLLATDIDAAISSRMATFSYTAPPSAASIATAVWQDLTSSGDFTTTGSIGKLLVTDVDAAISSRMATFTLPANFADLAIDGTGDVTVGTFTVAALQQFFLTDTSEAYSGAVPGSIVDEIILGSSGGGGGGGGGGDPWLTALPGAYAVGTAGYILGTFLDDAISSRMATFTLPAHFSSMAIDASGDVTVGAFTVPALVQFLTTDTGEVYSDIVVGSIVWEIVNAFQTTITDPWSAELPDAYTVGQAGYILGHNLNVPVSTRSTYAGVDTPGTATLLTRIAAPIMISAGGGVAIDWGNILNQSATVNLSNTTIGLLAGLTPAGAASFFTVESGLFYANAVPQSVVKEIALAASTGTGGAIVDVNVIQWLGQPVQAQVDGFPAVDLWYTDGERYKNYNDVLASASSPSVLTLGASEPADCTVFVGQYLAMHNGACVGQERIIIAATGRQVTLDRPLVGTPAAGDQYLKEGYAGANVVELDGHVVEYTDILGVAQAGTGTTITLAASDTAGDDTYLDRAIEIYRGTGAGQARSITDYVASSKVATVDLAWTTTPDATSRYKIFDYVGTEGAGITTLLTRIGGVINITGGGVALDMTQAVPLSNTAQTVGDALNAARAQGFGKWALVGTTLTLYGPDGTTVVRAFALDSGTAPTRRS